MASTSKESNHLPPLPDGWTQHFSRREGRPYYFNKRTGAKTWDIRDIISHENLPASSVSRDINELSVGELERLLEEKKKKEEEEVKSNKTKRKSTTNDDINSPKRKKIVFDLPKSPKKNLLKNPIVTTQRLLINTNESSPEARSRKVDNDSSVDKSTTDDSLVLEEDELEELNKIKKKHKSPPKPKLKKSPRKVSTSPRSSIFSKNVSSPKLDNFGDFQSYKPPIIIQKANFVASNYKTQYVNYQNDKKLTYNRVDHPPSSSKVLRSSQRIPSPPRNVPLEVQRPLDVTPDNEVDVTPVYGDLNDSIELQLGDDSLALNYRQNDYLQSRDIFQSHMEPIGRPTEIPVAQSDPVPVPVAEPNVPEPDDSNDNDNEVSYEGERPPTPTLVRELQEEESMEWESIDMEEVLLETQRARDTVCQTMDCDNVTNADDEYKVCVTECLIVIDTNVFISSLNVIIKLMETDGVVVVIPWMVVQELDNLKSSDKQKTSVGARAGVRWLNNVLLSKSQKILPETAAQSRKVSTKFQSKSPDDRILATCLQLKEDGHKVILATNDVNLTNKALINHIQSGKSDNIMDILNTKEDPKNIDVMNSTEAEYDIHVMKELVDQARDCLRDSLEGVLRKEFIHAYGENMWEKIVSIKPQLKHPYWTLGQLFTLFSKHHIAVFGQCFPRNGHDLKLRLSVVKEKLGTKWFTKLLDIKVVLAEIEKLFEVIRRREDYDGLVSICSEKLADLSSQVQDMEQRGKQATKNIIDNVEISDNNDDNVKDLFQNVWEIIAAFTRGFAVFLDVPTNIPGFEPNIQFHSLADVSGELPSFFSAVSNLQEAMMKVVTVNDESSITTFHSLLTGFRSNLELNQSFWPVRDNIVTRKQLMMFLRQSSNKEIISNGLEQISVFRQDLINCICKSNDNS